MKKLLLMVAAFVMPFATASADTVYPSTTEDFAKLTVMLTNGQSGGTGIIYKSRSTGSYVLTNRHVCKLAESGNGLNVITYEGKTYQVSKYVTSKEHDVCVAKVSVDLGYDTVIARERTKFGEEVTVTGHPYLYPTMVKKGHMSNDMNVQIITEWVKCKKEDYESNAFLCAFFGGLPVVANLETQTASFTIAGGNSGSSVFNSNGEITALVFAGSGRGMSPAILVPHEYILQFLNKETKELKWIPIENSYVYGRKNDTKTRRTNSRAVITDAEQLLKLNNLVFPALKSTKVDKFIGLFQCLQEGGKICFAK